MPRINLLPWREEDRKRRQREFLVAMGGALVAGIVVLGGLMFAFAQMIDTQRGRNARLTEEIAVLDKSISEIDGLERQKERLLARMEIIEQLQRSRPEVVHLFDEMSSAAGRRLSDRAETNRFAGRTQGSRPVEHARVGTDAKYRRIRVVCRS
jgi:Tfp pilus assembly protein PilN